MSLSAKILPVIRLDFPFLQVDVSGIHLTFLRGPLQLMTRFWSQMFPSLRVECGHGQEE